MVEYYQPKVVVDNAVSSRLTDLHNAETNATNYQRSPSALIAEVDKMQLEVRE